jgi:tetratricopeptide (TPR) repeat protein
MNDAAASPAIDPESSLPPLIRGVLAERVAQLSPTARDVATTAAVIGREFTFAALARVSRESEDTVVRGLDELWQRRIVREQGAGAADTYDFTHGKLREHIYRELSPAARRLLHGRVAEALEALATDEFGDLSSLRPQLADHYERAGRADRAIPHLVRAGEAALGMYANAEALRISERALALLTEQATGRVRRQAPWETVTQVYGLSGDIRARIGRYDEAIHAYQEALAHLPEQGAQISRAALHRKLATTWNQASTHPHLTYRDAARQQFQAAEDALTQVEDSSNSEWRQEWLALQFARIWPLSSSADDMTTSIEKAQPIVERFGTAEQREFLRYAVATRNFIRQRFVTSAVEIERFPARREGIAAIERGGDKQRLGQYLLAFGVTLLFAAPVTSHVDEAAEHLEHALRVAQEIGNRSLQTRCLTFLPFVFRLRGEVERMREVLIRAEAAGACQDNQILTGQRAWLAWREGRLADAEMLGRLALTVDPRHPESSAFQWVARWPLIGIDLARNQHAAAITDARPLLDPSQQPPPEHLRVTIEAALRAWDAGQEDDALALLHTAASSATELGFL